MNPPTMPLLRFHLRLARPIGLAALALGLLAYPAMRSLVESGNRGATMLSSLQGYTVLDVKLLALPFAFAVIWGGSALLIALQLFLSASPGSTDEFLMLRPLDSRWLWRSRVQALLLWTLGIAVAHTAFWLVITAKLPEFSTHPDRYDGRLVAFLFAYGAIFVCGSFGMLTAASSRDRSRAGLVSVFMIALLLFLASATAKFSPFAVLFELHVAYMLTVPISAGSYLAARRVSVGSEPFGIPSWRPSVKTMGTALMVAAVLFPPLAYAVAEWAPKRGVVYEIPLLEGKLLTLSGSDRHSQGVLHLIEARDGTARKLIRASVEWTAVDWTSGDFAVITDPNPIERSRVPWKLHWFDRDGHPKGEWKVARNSAAAWYQGRLIILDKESCNRWNLETNESSPIAGCPAGGKRFLRGIKTSEQRIAIQNDDAVFVLDEEGERFNPRVSGHEFYVVKDDSLYFTDLERKKWIKTALTGSVDSFVEESPWQVLLCGRVPAIDKGWYTRHIVEFSDESLLPEGPSWGQVSVMVGEDSCQLWVLEKQDTTTWNHWMVDLERNTATVVAQTTLAGEKKARWPRPNWVTPDHWVIHANGQLLLLDITDPDRGWYPVQGVTSFY